MTWFSVFDYIEQKYVQRSKHVDYIDYSDHYS